jgi:MoaA/NifB/PqqE/SkfB family radical SAM enzyme
MRPIDRRIIKDTAKRLVHNTREKKRTGLYPLELAILYVTMRCNAKCDHCFCWEDLNVGIPEFTLEQFAKLADSMPRVRMLLMTGGEPTLRRDLDEIFRIFASRDKADVIQINTNGLKPDKIMAFVEQMKAEFPGTGLDLQISLDGLPDTHDAIRGVPGNFAKALETARRVHELKRTVPMLSANLLTVITEKNYRELVELNELLQREVAPDVIHGFELVRDVATTAWGIPPEIAEKGVGPKAMKLPPVEDFPAIEADLKLIHSRGPFRANAFHIHNLAQLRMVATQREQYKCVTAGQAVAVLYSNGDVAHCEFTLPFANLREFDHDFDALWHSDAANERRRQIRSCYCIHGCFHGKAVEYSWRGVAAMTKAAL